MVRRYRDLIAWQLGNQFKAEVFRLLKSSPEAWSNLKYRSQLLDSAASVVANLVEGFLRFSPGEFPKFIDYSLGSLGEAEQRLRDGIELGYFEEADCETAFRLARRCLTASIRLKQSQRRIQPKKRR
jgi:four helix bundle protein